MYMRKAIILYTGHNLKNDYHTQNKQYWTAWKPIMLASQTWIIKASMQNREN